LNILYDYQIFSLQKYGGISRYYAELVSSISKGNTVNISRSYIINNYLQEYKVDTSKQSLVLKRFKGIDLLNYYLYRRELFRIKPDLVHHTYYGIKKFDHKQKHIITVYDLITELFDKNGSTDKSRVDAINNSDLIICISENTRKDLLDIYKVPNSKCHVTHLAGSLNSKMDIGKKIIDEHYILFVGKRSSYKNIKVLWETYFNYNRIRNDFKLVCFGGGTPTHDEIHWLEQHGMTDDIIFINGSDQILANLYTYASVFVYPSLYEGFGIPPLEAMSFQCPTICSSAGSIPEVVGNAGELFDPNDDEELGEIMLKVLYSTTYANTLVERGTKRNNAFTWKKTTEKTMQLYKSLL
jgi:glycosyltransferase involved in cell wall biosynthesis